MVKMARKIEFQMVKIVKWPKWLKFEKWTKVKIDPKCQNFQMSQK